MEIIFLGTNGWYDTKTGNTVCALLKTVLYDIVLDAGNGIHKLDKYINFRKPVYLFLSHLHLDHIAGLHILTKFNFRKGLYICGGRGIAAALKKLVNKPFTVPLKDLKFKTTFYELPAQNAEIPFLNKALPLVHADPVLGYRFEMDGRSVAYCTDTGYCANAFKLAKNADLLISECSHKSGETNKNWPHLNPESAAKLASEAAAGKLVLTHFDSYRYQNMKDRRDARSGARKIFKNVFAAVDGMRIRI